MKTMSVGVVGGGVVGWATARSYMEHAKVKVYDILPERTTHGFLETVCSDLVFVCLPTPQQSDSLECDTSAIDGFFENLSEDPDRKSWRNTGFVLRSTVPVGTTRRLRDMYGITNLMHSPEFLTARCAITDAQIPARNILGIPDYPGMGRDSPRYEKQEMTDPGEAIITCDFGLPEHVHQLFGLYRKRFPGVQIFMMSSDESEAVKLFLNGFFAVKVAYWNEIRTLADQLGLDWKRVMEGVLSDGRIAHAHTQVPGPDGKFGFGGECLPKDLASLVWQMQCLSDPMLGPLVGQAALTRNRFDRERQP